MSNFQKMNIMKKLLFLLLSVFTLKVAQDDKDKLSHGKGGIHHNGESILGHEI